MGAELVVRGGLVVDGSGRPGFRADVAVSGGRIVAVGDVDEVGAREIAAEGLVVTPGFVDGHTHLDAQLFWDPLGSNSCWHGVTTAVMGNCGFTLAPVRPDARELVVRNLERAEDMAPACLAAGVPWGWSTFAEYLDAVDAAPKGINYAANIGHSALRTWVMGERAFTEDAGSDDLDAMATELRSALRAGAVGFTTSRSTHETSDDRPVASRRAGWDEVRALVSVLADERCGVFQLTPEQTPGNADPERRAEYERRLEALAVDTGVPVNFPVLARPDYAEDLAMIDRCASRGGRMFGITHSRGIAIMLSFRTKLPFDVLPEWAEIRALPLERQRGLLGDPAVRARLVGAAHHDGYARAVGTELRPPDYDLMRVVRSAYRPNPTVAQEAARRGVDPVEAIIDLALESDFDQFFSQPIFAEDPADQLAVLQHPRTVMTFSDSGAHVSQIVDCSIQTHLLAYCVREVGAFTLAEAVRMLTSVPAAAWGFTDRGLIREGLAADLNVFDPARVAPSFPTVAHDLPAGATRLIQTA